MTTGTMPVTTLRMPRQCAGVNRDASPAAAAGQGGVEAAGLFDFIPKPIGDLLSGVPVLGPMVGLIDSLGGLFG